MRPARDVILIETVGVGQGEIEVVRFADCTIVVLVPGMGDDIQNLKAGLMEIGDIFVLNKSDREGAQRFEQQLTAMLADRAGRDGWRPPVVRTVATEGKGIDDLARQIERLSRAFRQSAIGRQARELHYWKEWLLRLLETRLMERVVGQHMNEAQFESLAAEVAGRKKDPYTAVNEILARAAWESIRKQSMIASRGDIVKLGELEFHIVSDGSRASRWRRDVWRDPQAAVGKEDVRRMRATASTLAMNCLLIRAGGKRILVETGAGDKMSPKLRDIYGLDGPQSASMRLRDYGVAPEDIDIVIDTHLHFDHCGGNTRIEKDKVVPPFPTRNISCKKANSSMRMNPTERDRASYFADNYAAAAREGPVAADRRRRDDRPGRGSGSRAGPHGQHAVREAHAAAARRHFSWPILFPRRASPASVDYGLRSLPDDHARK